MNNDEITNDFLRIISSVIKQNAETQLKIINMIKSLDERLTKLEKEMGH